MRADGRLDEERPRDQALLAGVLHRQSVGAVTGRTAFALKASAFAFA
jgi:hypothetical protein